VRLRTNTHTHTPYVYTHTMSHYTRGFFPPNPNKSTDGKNADDVKLEEEIGVEVIGRLQWEKYITTSPKAMAPGDKPTPATVSKNVSAARPSREGWVFQHVTRTAERWAMEVWPCPTTPKKLPCYTSTRCEKLFPKHITSIGPDTRPQRTRTRRTRMLERS